MRHGRYDDDYGDGLFQFLHEDGLHVRRGCGYSNLDMSVKLVPPLELQALQGYSMTGVAWGIVLGVFLSTGVPRHNSDALCLQQFTFDDLVPGI